MVGADQKQRRPLKWQRFLFGFLEKPPTRASESHFEKLPGMHPQDYIGVNLFCSFQLFFSPLQSSNKEVGWHLLFFCGWLFCPVLLFLYAMLLAANVTAKASRVAPLVNSWTFEAGWHGPGHGLSTPDHPKPILSHPKPTKQPQPSQPCTNPKPTPKQQHPP